MNGLPNDANGSKVPRNSIVFLFRILDLLRFFVSDFFRVDATENEMKRALNLAKYGAHTA